MIIPPLEMMSRFKNQCLTGTFHITQRHNDSVWPLEIPITCVLCSFSYLIIVLYFFLCSIYSLVVFSFLDWLSQNVFLIFHFPGCLNLFHFDIFYYYYQFLSYSLYPVSLIPYISLVSISFSRLLSHFWVSLFRIPARS